MVQRQQRSATRKPESVWRHIGSFAVMILLTAAAFYLVANHVVPRQLILPFILLFAVIQVFLQLFTFMHLSQRGSTFYTLFIMIGIFIASISALGLLLM